jgi:hypothetical protein
MLLESMVHLRGYAQSWLLNVGAEAEVRNPPCRAACDTWVLAEIGPPDTIIRQAAHKELRQGVSQSMRLLHLVLWTQGHGDTRAVASCCARTREPTVRTVPRPAALTQALRPP